MDVIIKGARLVDSTMDSRTSVGDIVIENGCISDVVIGDCGIASSDKFQMIDAHGLTAMPAFVDLHAHFRDSRPYIQGRHRVWKQSCCTWRLYHGQLNGQY